MQFEPRFTELLRTPFFVPWETTYIFSEFNLLEGALSPLPVGAGGGGGSLGLIFAGYVPLAITVYTVAIL